MKLPVGWDSARTPVSISAIVDTLLAEYDVERQRLEDDVLRLAHEFIEANLASVESN